MKKQKWYFESQKTFRKWREENKLSANCIKQIITKYSLEEHWFIFPEMGGQQEFIKLFSYEGTGEVYFVKEYSGERVVLKERDPLNKKSTEL